MKRRNTPEADAQRAIVQALRIALPRDASALRHALLARWAEEAGAQALMLVVRRAE